MVHSAWHRLQAWFLPILCGLTMPCPGASNEWVYSRQLHRAIASVDRIVVRHGGYDCCHAVDKDPVLLVVTNREVITDFLARLEFEPVQHSNGFCMCCGYPGIDWYSGTNRLALTSLKHGRSIRWKGFPGDTALTMESSIWLANWLAGYGVARPKEEMERTQNTTRLTNEGVEVLKRELGEDLYGTISRIETTQWEMSTGETNGPSLLDRMRSLWPGDEALSEGLFRMLGTLTGTWRQNTPYPPERVSKSVLDQMRFKDIDGALKTARASTNRSVQIGAARYLFGEGGLDRYGTSRVNRGRWAEWFVDDALNDPFPANRVRVVAYLPLLGYQRQLQSLEKALADPDETVRSKASEVLWGILTDEARELAGRVADGTITPRPAMETTKDYHALH